MRIKQDKLIGRKPTKAFVRFVNGVHAMVLLYEIDGQYFVNIIADKGDGKEIKHCYPLTKEQYDVYYNGDNIKAQQELIAKGGKIYGRA